MLSPEEEWCRKRIENLQIKDLEKDTQRKILNEIKERLSANEPEAVLTSNFLQLSVIFDCLDAPESEQTNLACDVISICMSNLDLGESLSKNSNLLEKSLNHPNPNVKLLGLNELIRIVKHNSNLISDSNLVMATVKALNCSETSVGAACITLLSKVLRNYIEIGGIKAELEKIMVESQDIVKCRIYEIGINLTKSENGTEKVDFILSKMVDEFKASNDILLQLSILELTSDLALNESGLLYLENKGFFSNLIKMIETPNEYILLIPGLMKFFGSVAAIHPQKIFNKYPTVIDGLFDCIISNDSTNLPTALDTLGHLALNTDGKIILNTINKMPILLKELSNNIGVYPTELKIRGLNCLERIFYTDDPGNNQIVSITQSWYTNLSPLKDLSFVVPFSKNSFPDIKMAGLKLLKSIVYFRWGQEYLYQTAGFIEFLLDRRAEFDKNVIREKFEIVKDLTESTVFDRDTTNQLKKYVMEGAFYVETVIEVAVEGAD